MARIYRMAMPQPDAAVFDRYSYYDYGTALEPAVVLAHAYGEVTGGVLDFKAQIALAKSAEDLLSMHQMLVELREIVTEVEASALDKVDAMRTGSAA